MAPVAPSSGTASRPFSKASDTEPFAVCAGATHAAFSKSTYAARTRRQPKTQRRSGEGSTLYPWTVTRVPPSAGPLLGLDAETTTSW